MLPCYTEANRDDTLVSIGSWNDVSRGYLVICPDLPGNKLKNLLRFITTKETWKNGLICWVYLRTRQPVNKFVHSTKASHPKSLLPTNLKIGGYNHYSKFNVKERLEWRFTEAIVLIASQNNNTYLFIDSFEQVNEPQL